MVSIRALLVLAVLSAVATEARQEHGHVRGGSSMALVLSANTVEDATAADDSCDVANGQGCQRQLKEQEYAPPEFIPTHEWQDILPNQAVPPGLYIRINLNTGKKEAKLLE